MEVSAQLTKVLIVHEAGDGRIFLLLMYNILDDGQ
jgi:hypothetical protein